MVELDPWAPVEWEIWHRDTFDREEPSACVARGVGLTKGLVQLWARYLFETVHQVSEFDGKRMITRWLPGGFSELSLHWAGRRVEIGGDDDGPGKLRLWIFGEQENCESYARLIAERPRLRTVAEAHALIVTAPNAPRRILRAARSAADWAELEASLANLSVNP